MRNKAKRITAAALTGVMALGLLEAILVQGKR